MVSGKITHRNIYALFDTTAMLKCPLLIVVKNFNLPDDDRRTITLEKDQTSGNNHFCFTENIYSEGPSLFSDWWGITLRPYTSTEVMVPKMQ
jgi:hypothetical protein